VRASAECSATGTSPLVGEDGRGPSRVVVGYRRCSADIQRTVWLHERMTTVFVRTE
jgi:hypothetical protein